MAGENAGGFTLRQLNSGIGAQFGNSHYEQLNSGIAQIPSLLGMKVLNKDDCQLPEKKRLKKKKKSSKEHAKMAKQLANFLGNPLFQGTKRTPEFSFEMFVWNR